MRSLYEALGVSEEAETARPPSLGCVEHFPSLHSQWMRWTLIATESPPTPDIPPPQHSTLTRWASIDAVRSGDELIDGRVDLLRILDTLLPSLPPSSVPFSPYPTIPQIPDHLRVILLLTSHRHLLLLLPHTSPTHPPIPPSHSPLTLPSTHCDRGETLTFTAHRFARALLGLTRVHPSLIRVEWGGVQGGGVGTWWHAGVEGGGQEGEEEEWEVEGGGEGKVWRSYERARWVAYEEVERLWRAGQVREDVWTACQLISTAEQGATVGVPTVHVHTDAPHTAHSDA